MRHIHKCISKSSAIQLVHAFVTCQLLYCNSIFHDFPGVQASRLQAVRLVTSSLTRKHIAPQIKSFHWLPYLTASASKASWHSAAYIPWPPKYLPSYIKPVFALPSNDSLRSFTSGITTYHSCTHKMIREPQLRLLSPGCMELPSQRFTW